MTQRSFYLPRDELRPYVDRYWAWHGGDGLTSLPWMLPGTGSELMFVTKDPAVPAQDLPQGFPRAFLLCIRTHPYQLPSVLNYGCLFSVRIRSGATRHFCAAPLEALFDRPIPLEEIWGGMSFELIEKIASAQNHLLRVAIIEDWLLAQLCKYSRQNMAIEAAIWHLYYQSHETKIEVLAERLGMSRRHFERLFRQHIGMAPKVFQRTARFHLTVRDLFLSGAKKSLETALEHGYYDQSHFIHDFESFVGCSPSDYLRLAIAKSHFYNSPLLTPDTIPLPR